MRLIGSGASLLCPSYATCFKDFSKRSNAIMVDYQAKGGGAEPATIVEEIVHQLRKSDVIFGCGDAVHDIQVVGDSPRQASLHRASGKHLVADVVLFSAGRIGATEDLKLAAAGLRADERGCRVLADKNGFSGPDAIAGANRDRTTGAAQLLVELGLGRFQMADIFRVVGRDVDLFGKHGLQISSRTSTSLAELS